MSGPRKGRRQLAELRTELSERDLAVLDSAYQLRLVSARQIERLHFVAPRDHATALSAARSCRRILERLVRDRLLLRLERRIGGVRAGSASFIYAIGPVGQRLLADSGPRRRWREPSALFVAHTLAVSELYVRVHEAVHSEELQLLAPIEPEPRCWRTVIGVGGAAVLKPDLSVALGNTEYEYRWFVEVDLGTEHRPALIRKCRTYESYYLSGVEQARLGVFPRVLWVAPDEGRAAVISGTITGLSGASPGLFVVTTTDHAIGVLSGEEGRP